MYNGVNIDKKLNHRQSLIPIPEAPTQIPKTIFKKPPPVIQLEIASIQIMQSNTNLEKKEQDYPNNYTSLVTRSFKQCLSSSMMI